jgi:hypothetical protein
MWLGSDSRFSFFSAIGLAGEGLGDSVGDSKPAASRRAERSSLIGTGAGSAAGAAGMAGAGDCGASKPAACRRAARSEPSVMDSVFTAGGEVWGAAGTGSGFCSMGGAGLPSASANRRSISLAANWERSSSVLVAVAACAMESFLEAKKPQNFDRLFFGARPCAYFGQIL